MNRLSTFLSEHIGIELWVASLIAIALVTVALNQVAQVLLRHAAKVTERTASVWDDALVQTASRPVLAAMWVIGASVMARVVQRQVEEPFLAEAMALRDVALIICAAWFLWRFIGKVGSNIVSLREQRGEDVDHTTLDALGKLSRLVTLIVAILMTAQTLGFQITGLLALGGVGGIAVGFAAKDLLANFFGGLTIYLDRPFSVGEWIRSPDKSLEGTVEYISWRHTRIRAFNKNPIYVPNAVFTSIVVENPSRMSHRRIKETIGLRYDDFAVVPAVVADIRDMLRAHPEIDTTQTLIVNFNQFAGSSLDLMIYTFTKTTVWVKYHEVKQDVLIRIGQIIERHGAEIAFPTRTLHLHGGELPPEQASEAAAPAPDRRD
ncbi:MAG: mechanosensitive ion channel family protein [Rhodoferax sp.]|nr:mechanosensitive ion channel family protein [Rhodoferax sp.]MCB2004973.1 mechanosensitive ion channel family protein [Rhodoferax sp.]MCB2030335.1 mechanosensitive ion channel family protein [Rhodoferax sp.]MCB2039529.1 mechanosensitive ion channel family protein [Rhodoferax sp.]MCP5260724.1 mechanosensitive ion channel family protein [Rhodoferax sp.]